MPTTDINTGSVVVNDEPVTVDPIADTSTGGDTARDDVNTDIPVDTSATADVNENEPVVDAPVTSGGGGGWPDEEGAKVTAEQTKKFFDKSINLMGVGLTTKDILISLGLGAAGFWAAKRTNQQPTGLIGYTLAGMLAGITLSKLVIKKKQ